VAHYPEKLGDIEHFEIFDDDIETTVEKIKTTEIAELGLFFQENIQYVQQLILTPYIVASSG
jgi:hypothetical protein